jgi:peptidoglycan/xylan/chitin deacetylase (PgdA/CDA1 family)
VNRRALVASAIALAAVLLAGYAFGRLLRKSDDRLRPVVVRPADNAAQLVHPSWGMRLHAITAAAPPMATRERLIALTFDDGPYPITTPLLLQTLADLRVPATFFLIGRDAQQYPDLEREIAAGGHEIADHTLTHPDLDKLGAAAVSGELRDGAAALRAIAPDPAEATLFRPPHGRYTLATLQAAQAAGYTAVLWNDDPGDWRSVGAADIAAHVLARATAPEILLLHSGRPATVAALPGIVAAYRRAGYTFLRVNDLLARVQPDHLEHPARSALTGS